MRPEQFQYNHNTYTYAKSPGGNERTVEVALVLDFIGRYCTQETRALEIGHVLRGPNRFFMNVTEMVKEYVILDKFEKGDGVINEDLRTYEPARPFDIVVSVSTLEHVGVDEEEDPSEAIIGFAKARGFMYHRGGFFFTIPVGFNIALQRHVVYGEHEMHVGAMQRVSTDNEWTEIAPEEALSVPYGRPYRHGNAVLIGTSPPVGVS